MKKRFNQGGLTLYSQCPLKFKKCWLDGLRLQGKEFLPPKQRAALERGSQFHLLAERFFHGLPEESCADMQLDLWLRRLRHYLAGKTGRYWPEYQLYYEDDVLQLTAKYDLLYQAREQEIIIYDWKTNEQKQKRQDLEQSWQTVVYRYVLVKASPALFGQEIRPEAVKMIYWNPCYPETEEIFLYDSSSFLADEARILEMVEKIAADRAFLPIQGKNCRFCAYRWFCQQKKPLLTEEAFDLDWAEVEAYPF